MIHSGTTKMPNIQNDDDLYESAIAALFSPLHQSTNPEALATAASRRTLTISDMHTYLERIGVIPSALPFPVIHVTGTKGKGSVCSMCESILRRSYGKNTGLFTSPHLLDIRERIRINGKLVSKSIFGRAYWDIRQLLECFGDGETMESDLPVLPGYFRMLTLLALYIFVHYENPQLDVVILEVGMGGRYDATNFVTSSSCLVRGITVIDYDHCRVLGNTLESIAWEKAGIYQINKSNPQRVAPHPEREKDAYQNALQDLLHKRNSTEENSSRHSSSIFFALDTNPDSVINVFRVCADIEGEGGIVQFVGTRNPRIPTSTPIGLPGSHQRINAELALALCESVCRLSFHSKVMDASMEVLCSALSEVTWPGRCQTIAYPMNAESSSSIMLRLDGAHTVQSIKCGLEWYQSVSKSDAKNVCRILVFNCSHERNPVELLALLQPLDFHAVFFCRADSERPSMVPKAGAAELLAAAGIQVMDQQLLLEGASSVADESVSWQDTLAQIWKHLGRDSKKFDSTISSNTNAKEALEGSIKIGEKYDSTEIFVTGSLYLVGSMLSAIDWKEPDAEGELRIPQK